MQALLTRIAGTTVRRNGFVAIPSVIMCRDIWSKQMPAPAVPTVSSPTRGMAVERMVNGMKITEDMKVSEPVRKVLSPDNGSRKQQKQILKTLEIEKWRRHVADTGSPECQIAALTVRIDSLYDHVHSSARKDFACKRGLVKLMARRRKMLSYLKRKDFEIYRKVALETGLR